MLLYIDELEKKFFPNDIAVMIATENEMRSNKFANENKKSVQINAPPNL